MTEATDEFDFEVDAETAASNFGVQASEPAGLSPVCQLPFEGWAAFADVVSESDQGLAGLMAGALILREPL